MKHSREKEEAEVGGVVSLYETFNILDSRFNEITSNQLNQ